MNRAKCGVSTTICALLVATAVLDVMSVPTRTPVLTPTPAAEVANASSKYATHYDFGPGGGGTNGNCSFPEIPKGELYVAVGPDKYRHGAGCGTYLEVTGPKGKVAVVVMDQCHECEPGHLDLSDTAFRKIGNYNDGKIPVKFKAIKNPTVPPIALRFKEGSSASWLALQIINNGNVLRGVAISRKDRMQWLRRTEYGYWLAPRATGRGPYSITIRDVLGHQATIRNVPLKPGELQDTKTRLYR
nr:hypothetical protein PCFP21_260 [Curtobacterium flaccumfaciens pv. poinsettiae]WQM79198.1 hypothetical protein PCFP23_245 [Curtobacterium flaccumfaciens pv. poinsettiae]WQM79338.1 hypothetical protein PCFP24_440 [Curtobacterium flaccumfaciens pv. poinsettiae]WQM79413.1 hypothetical protein PCFP11_330 [Curtobacterium flaccumfaciens pv. poinsettiae]WQM79448.1 hypothetical protein PCFP31_070 [Curtobacterium flaccumfaciens pv. poinsettiae]